MTHGIDTSFLVPIEIASHSRHEAASALFMQLLAAGDDFALTPQVLSEFIHVATDSKRFTAPLTMAVAIERSQTIWDSGSVHRMHSNASSISQFHTWLTQYGLGRKRVLDTLLAATYLSHGVRSIMTLNPGDFTIFNQFQLMTPQGT